MPPWKASGSKVMLCTSQDKVYRTISKQKSKLKEWEIKCLICLFRLFQPKRGRRCRKEKPKKGKAPPVTRCRNTGLLFHFLPRNVLQKREFNVHEWTNCPGDQINDCSIKNIQNKIISSVSGSYQCWNQSLITTCTPAGGPAPHLVLAP